MKLLDSQMKLQSSIYVVTVAFPQKGWNPVTLFFSSELPSTYYLTILIRDANPVILNHDECWENSQNAEKNIVCDRLI